jgi:hypothetical protein
LRKLYRGPSIGASYHISLHLPTQFQRRFNEALKPTKIYIQATIKFANRITISQTKSQIKQEDYSGMRQHSLIFTGENFIEDLP